MPERTCVTASAALAALALSLLTPVAHADAAAPLVIGHRGAAGLAPENTLEAVDRADRAGIDWVEVDVQRSKDGVLVLMHDPDLVRTTDAEKVFPHRAPWRVGDFTYAELSRLRAGASARWKGTRYETARVPTLGQALDRLDRNGQGLLLELKWPGRFPGVVQDTLRVLDRKGWLDAHHVHDRLYVISFLPAALKTVRKERPDIKLGICDERATAGELASYATYADVVNPEHGATTAHFVRRAHALKGPHGKPLKVWPWTVNTPTQARRLRDLRVDGFTTDFPDRMRRVLGQ
ncbi:glycerophosphodiester phosphodiesterase family protein [Streptomyces sp. A012304]|uniref:glycerophosphodiester phosphodiesterase n=1 Tax=Streptomyces sp. A012304 TaxID=375446 RepID=UPI00222EABC0|nr:glycerophosphodiester phosphodiesterase family protein [Streptomyces sp. A012304]GKQ36503.1 hydrolase [Streptomyces sp. A012304]